MKIIVVGTGYVGLVTGACLADVGISVTCVDINQEKIKALKNGEIPIYEPGLDKIVERNIKAQRLNFTTHLSENIQDANAIFIAVGTPPDKEGNADLQYVKAVAKEIGENMQDYLVVVTKSTVPVGTSQLIKKTIEEQLEKRNSPIEFDVASNPEFLKEGAAIDDFMKPDRVVIGVENDRAKNMLEKIYKPFQLNGYRIIYMDVTSAELTKYTANAMLATRISFMNDIANICEKVGANINQIRAGIGADPRIGKKFLYAGLGYGGSCFPKDVKALIKTGEELNHPLRILQAVDDVNQDQKRVLFHKISKAFKNLKGKTIAVWGLSFKPNTDDLREAPAIDLIHDLVKSGVRVRAVDPVAAHEAKKILPPEVEYCEDVYTSAQGADAIALVTEWNQFRFPNWGKLKKMMNGSHIFDGRNIYDLELIESKGFTYHGIGL
ncbi:UDP-glucose 6-dehydrogenase tuaD [Candidatus Ornithobacterium hominis]|uniref:UDP-glucose 6-dehydrogenase n=1 Tax=Candidatus Ornithobacterium hominis TaxID=2497989 RepID=A0A383TW34_9FLAO|nr:UDP-glucose/GDP-mannose dehydrogenase family protein [Candidatus Ornithobacterium hominis]MCT7904482.1 UDP-glucose/GDP-mannose dehydrogenase family protein [Candidatus Ornithobacterium hominis]SZD71379.1 UDP-glucose 6-dehydrogenase tuaD [Candidatus Ornithobacterium hominis]